MIQYKFISSSPISLFFVLESASKFYFIFFTFFIVVQVQLSPFSPHHCPPPQPSPPPILNPTPIWLCPCVFYTCSFTTPSPPPLSPPTSTLVTVNLFLISTSLVMLCLLVCFVDQVPLIDEIIWYVYEEHWYVFFLLSFAWF